MSVVTPWCHRTFAELISHSWPMQISPFSPPPSATNEALFSLMPRAAWWVPAQLSLECLSHPEIDFFEIDCSIQGITSLSLSQDTVAVLGNMCCTLNVSYIMNSDPSILEKLKNCPDLTSDQVAAVEARLLSGKTQYGYVCPVNTFAPPLSGLDFSLTIRLFFHR